MIQQNQSSKPKMHRRNPFVLNDKVTISNEQLIKEMKQSKEQFKVNSHFRTVSNGVQKDHKFIEIIKRTIPSVCARNIINNESTHQDLSKNSTKEYFIHRNFNSGFLPYSHQKGNFGNFDPKITTKQINSADIQSSDRSILALKENIKNILTKVESDKERRKTTIDSKIKQSQKLKFGKYWQILPQVPGSQVHLLKKTLAKKNTRAKIKSVQDECFFLQDNKTTLR